MMKIGNNTDKWCRLMRFTRQAFRGVRRLRVFIVLFIISANLPFLAQPSVATQENKADPQPEQANANQGFSNITTPSFIAANGKTMAVLSRAWSGKLGGWGPWELVEVCPYSRWRLGRGNEGLTYSVSEAYLGARYSKDNASHFEWSNDFPNIDYADYVAGAPIIQINISTPASPDIRVTWTFFASEAEDVIIWGASITNLAGAPLNDIILYLNFEAPINNEYCDFVWNQNERAYVVEKPHLGIYVSISSWTPPAAYYAGEDTKQMIYYDLLKNTTGRTYANSCGFKWHMGTLSPGESSQALFFFIALGESPEDALNKVHNAKQKSPSQHYEATRAFWKDWLRRASLDTPDPYLNKMFDLSLMFSLMGIHRPSGAVIACMDGTRWMRWGGEAPGSRWMFRPYYLHIWVRDLVFFSMVFDLLGYVDEARDALYFAKSVQSPSGSFYTFYEVDRYASNTWPNETDQTALYVYGVYLHYCATGDLAFLEETWDSVQRACEYLERMQNYSGLVYTQASLHEWSGVSQGYEPWTQACSYAAFVSGSRIARVLGQLSKASEWEAASERIRSGTLNYLWNPAIDSFSGRFHRGKQYTWADIKMITPFLFYTPLLNASDWRLRFTYNYLLENLNDPEIGGIWRYQKGAGQPMVPERWNGGYGPWFTYTCWFALFKLANGEVDEAFDWILWCKEHATAQGLFSEHISTYLWDYLYQDSAKATRSYYGIGTFGGWIAYTLASIFIRIVDPSGLNLYPYIPSYWNSMNLTFTYKKTTFTVVIRGQGAIDKIMIDDEAIQSLRIPDKYYDQDSHTILINLTKPVPPSPYVKESHILNLLDSSYDYDSEALSLEISAPYLLDSTVQIVSPKEPIVVYVNNVSAPRSQSLTTLSSYDVGWMYNSTEKLLYIKIRASVNPITVSSIFSCSLTVRTTDYYNAALPDSVVTISWPNGTEIQVQRSDGEGYAHLSHLSKGAYNMRVEHRGVIYETWVKLETATTSLMAKLEIVGFFFATPITKAEVDIALILLTALAAIYVFRRYRTPLERIVCNLTKKPGSKIKDQR